MSTFTAIVFGAIALMVIGLFVIGRGSKDYSLQHVGLRSAQEILETRATLEEEDLAQMLAAHNARRARRGEAAVSAEEIELRLMQEQGELEREREAMRRSGGEGPAPPPARSDPGSRWAGLD
jgi:hypothetical protein